MEQIDLLKKMDRSVCLQGRGRKMRIPVLRAEDSGGDCCERGRAVQGPGGHLLLVS